MNIQNKGLSAEQPQEGISRAVVEPLAGTQGWVRFLAVLGFIVCGFMFIAGLFGLVMGLMAGQFQAVVAIIPALLVGCLYLVPSLKLNQYASSISWLRQTQSLNNLARALEAQRAFWAFIGIFTTIILGIYLVILAFGILATIL